MDENRRDDNLVEEPVPQQDGTQEFQPQNGAEPQEFQQPQQEYQPASVEPQQPIYEQPQPDYTPIPQPVYQPAQAAAKRQDKKLFGIIAGGVVVVLIGIIALFMMISGGKAIKLQDYVTITYSGVDGKGTAYVSVDYESMAQAALTSKEKSQMANGDITSVSTWQTAAAGWGALYTKQSVLSSAITCTLEDQPDGLSNGDTVTVQVDIDKDALKAVGIKVKGKNFTDTVSGLIEVQNIDAFADISVQFSGIAPNGEAQVINNSRDAACMQYEYDLDKSEGLSNDDTVTVTISDYNLDDIAEQTGEAPAEMQKTYTVSGLSSYVSKLDQIDDTTWMNMKREAEDHIRARAANDNSDVESMTGMKYVGSYLEVAKPGSSARLHNCLDLVYEIAYTNSNPPGISFNYYYIVAFDDLVLQGDNSIQVDLSDYTTTSNTFRFDVGDRGFYLYGYQTLKDLFDDWIVKTMDVYTYETNIQ